MIAVSSKTILSRRIERTGTDIAIAMVGGIAALHVHPLVVSQLSHWKGYFIFSLQHRQNNYGIKSAVLPELLQSREECRIFRFGLPGRFTGWLL